MKTKKLDNGLNYHHKKFRFRTISRLGDIAIFVRVVLFYYVQNLLEIITFININNKDLY